MHRNRTGGLVAAAVASLIIAVSTSCTSGAGGGSASSGPSLSAPSPDARSVAEQRALDAYRGMWKAYSAAGRVADPHHPDLTRFAADDALKVLIAGLESNKAQGLISQGEPVLNPQTASATPESAPTEVRVRDCADTTNAVRIRPSGAPFTDTPGGRRLVSATVRDIGGGTWKVVNFAVNGVGSC